LLKNFHEFTHFRQQLPLPKHLFEELEEKGWYEASTGRMAAKAGGLRGLPQIASSR